jgi:FixJ family two-component response regulator
MPNLDPTPTVCVIDDDDSVRKSLRRFLESCRFAVLNYASGNAFLAEMQSPKIGCLVCDFQMPGLNGLETLRLAQSRGWSLPAIIITGVFDASLEQQVLRSGGLALLRKPIEPQVLLSIIDKALRGHSKSL